MAVDAWRWSEYHLLVTVNNRQGTYYYLLKYVSQEDFVEHYYERMRRDVGNDNRTSYIRNMQVTELTEATYDLMEPLHPADMKMEGD